MYVNALLTLVALYHGPPATNTATFDPGRPPPRLEPWTDLAPPIEIATSDDATGTAWVRRLDGHTATFSVGITVEGDLFDGSLAAVHCIDTLWPGHVHVALGQGPTVRDGYDWLVFGSARHLTFMGSVVTPYADDAAEYVRRLLSGERPAPSTRIVPGRLRDPRSEPNFMRIPLWALDHPEAGLFEKWTLQRCRSAIARGVASGAVKVAVASATAEPWHKFATIAGNHSNVSTDNHASPFEPEVIVATWEGADLEGFAIAAADPASESLARTVFRTLRVSVGTSGGAIFSVLRNDLGASYVPTADRQQGRVLVAATTPPDKQIEAVRAVLAKLRDADALLEDAKSAIKQLDRIRWDVATSLLHTPHRALDPMVAALVTSNERPSFDADDIAHAIAGSFSRAKVVLVEARIDHRTLEDACTFAQRMSLRRISVVELPNGGTRTHTCGSRR